MKKIISEFGQILIGIVLASIGLKAFLLPNHFLDGGVTGISILISEITDIDISILLVIISVPFILLAWYTVSRRIVYKSIFSIIALALFIHFENFESLTEDKLLIAIFGGLFLGLGIGITIKNGSVLDGSEILGIFFNDRLGISIGKVILVFNVILFSVTAVVLSIETAMYSVLTYLITSKVIDLIIEGFEDYVGLMIVSDRFNEIQEALINEVGTGMTIYSGKKGYGTRGMREESEIIHTIINRIDIMRTHHLIEGIDKQAFIIEFDVNNVKGGIRRKYLSREGIKKTISNIVES